MTLISKTAMVRWNGFTRKHYEERGYIWTKANEYFECRIDDLQKNSTVKIWVECDYCGEPHQKTYRDLFKNKELTYKHCCNKRSCMVKKSEEVSMLKYGVTNYTKTQESKQYHRELYQTSREEILKITTEKGLEVLNIDDYENDRTRLFVICKTHKDKGIQETNFANIKSNKHCCVYIKNQPSKRRLDGDTIIQAFKDAKLIPLFKPEEYKSNSQPLPYMCPKHLDKGTQYRSYANLSHCIGCEYCSRERTNESLRTDQQEVLNYFLSKGLIVLEGQKYLNKEQQIFFKCKEHFDHIQSSSLGNLKSTKVPCIFCRNEQSLSSLNKRLRSSIGDWRENSIKECGNKCVLTGEKNFEVHHLYSFNSIIKDALIDLKIPMSDSYTGEELILIKNKVIELHENVSGVCIRPDLHILFHQIYGNKDNTEEQFVQFENDYLNNKYLEVINL